MSSAAPAPAVPIDHVLAPPRRLHPLLVLFLIWTGVGLFFGFRTHVNSLLFGVPEKPEWASVGLGLFDAYFWAVMTLVIFRLADRVRFTRRRWPLALAVHAAGAILAALASVVANMWYSKLMWPDTEQTLVGWFRLIYYIDIQWYGVILIVWHAMEYARRFRDREVAAAQLGARLAESRLEALKMQIQPHFLFNTLHSISELVHEDPDAADRMIIRLGDLLRLTVDNAQTHEVTLAQEMDFMEAYLEIQRTRFQDTLEVEVDIPDELQGALVPNLVLQPLMENAIRHGVAARGGVARIGVSARRDGGRLRLEVRDNGPGLPATPRARTREGVGLRNTRARLEQMYGAEQRFELKNGARAGAVATVEIPYRPAGAVAEEPELASVGEGR